MLAHLRISLACRGCNSGWAIAPVSNALRYNYLGDWIVVVTFDLSGRLINLNRFRPRP